MSIQGRKIKKESLLIQMQDKLNAYRSSETDMISEVMDNPSIILRENGEPLVWKGFDPKDDLRWVQEINFREIHKEERDSRTDFGISDFLAERNFYAGLSYGFSIW